MIICNDNTRVYVGEYRILQIVRGGKVSWYANLNCNSLENIRSWTVVLYGQSLLHRLFHWKSFIVTNQFAKATKLFHLERFAIYGIYTYIGNG